MLSISLSNQFPGGQDDVVEVNVVSSGSSDTYGKNQKREHYLIVLQTILEYFVLQLQCILQKITTKVWYKPKETFCMVPLRCNIPLATCRYPCMYIILTGLYVRTYGFIRICASLAHQFACTRICLCSSSYSLACEYASV